MAPREVRRTGGVIATIANGAALSSEFDIDGYALLAIHMPGAWTAANLTFQAYDDVRKGWFNVYDDEGNEVTVTAAVDRAIAVDAVAGKLAPFTKLKIRSGTSGVPVNQGGDRSIFVRMKS